METCDGTEFGTELLAVQKVGIQSAVTDRGPKAIPSISADGRFVTFESAANNLVPGDTKQDEFKNVSSRDGSLASKTW